MMSIDKIIEHVEEHLPECDSCIAGNLKEIKRLLKISKDIIVYGREDSIKKKLIEDISYYLREE